jgi:hypothetical protein
VVSADGGVSLKLIFAASLNTGLKEDVMSIDFFLVVSWADRSTKKQEAIKEIPVYKNAFFILFILFR